MERTCELLYRSNSKSKILIFHSWMYAVSGRYIVQYQQGPQASHPKYNYEIVSFFLHISTGMHRMASI